jgi:hypothetical protein
VIQLTPERVPLPARPAPEVEAEGPPRDPRRRRLPDQTLCRSRLLPDGPLHREEQ